MLVATLFISNLIHKLTLHPAWFPWFGTAGVLLLTVLLSRVGAYFVRARAESVNDARVLKIGLRYALTLFLLVSLFVVWAAQVRHFLFATAALLATLILVCKDLILCLLGDIVKFYGKLCPIGAIVQVEDMRGKVVDSGFLTTSLQLIDHTYSGQVATFPNSLFLTKAVRHLSKTGDYRVVLVRIPVSALDPVDRLADALSEVVHRSVHPYLQEAQAHFDRTREALLLDFPPSTPRVLIEPKNYEEVILVACFACPASLRSSLEQEILRAFYQRYASLRSS